jgi:hypothetical protein
MSRHLILSSLGSRRVLPAAFLMRPLESSQPLSELLPVAFTMTLAVLSRHLFLLSVAWLREEKPLFHLVIAHLTQADPTALNAMRLKVSGDRASP